MGPAAAGRHAPEPDLMLLISRTLGEDDERIRSIREAQFDDTIPMRQLAIDLGGKRRQLFVRREVPQLYQSRSRRREQASVVGKSQPVNAHFGRFGSVRERPDHPSLDQIPDFHAPVGPGRGEGPIVGRNRQFQECTLAVARYARRAGSHRVETGDERSPTRNLPAGSDQDPVDEPRA